MRRMVISESPELLGWLAENVPRSIPGASDCHGPWVMPGDVSSRKTKKMMVRMPVIPSLFIIMLTEIIRVKVMYCYFQRPRKQRIVLTLTDQSAVKNVWVAY